MTGTEPHNGAADPREVSVAATLARTAVLVGLTLGFALLFRFWHPAVTLVQTVAGTAAWQSLYPLLRIESGLGREQLILVAIVLFCFLLALGLQLGFIAALRALRRRRGTRPG